MLIQYVVCSTYGKIQSRHVMLGANDAPFISLTPTWRYVNIQIKIAMSRDKLRILIKILAESHMAFDCTSTDIWTENITKHSLKVLTIADY